MSPDDVGTRLQHLTDLYDLWNEGLEVMSRGTYHSEQELIQIGKLKIALDMLAKYMQLGYNQTPYAKEINKLGKGDTEEDETT